MFPQTLKRVLHSLSCGKHKVLKRIAATAVATEGAATGEKEKEKGQGGLIKVTDSFIFNAQFRYTHSTPCSPPTPVINPRQDG